MLGNNVSLNKYQSIRIILNYLTMVEQSQKSISKRQLEVPRCLEIKTVCFYVSYGSEKRSNWKLEHIFSEMKRKILHVKICIVIDKLKGKFFHSNPKERQYQTMFKLVYNRTHFTCQQDYAQTPSSQASAVCELRTSRCISWVQKRQRNQRSNCQYTLDHRKHK